MVVYEGMYILDPSKYSRDPAAIAGQLESLVTQFGGTMLAARLWDERRLAYPIKGQKKGVYWLTYFRMPASNLLAFERQCELNETILRRLILKVDPRLAEPLVQHALAGDAAATKRGSAAAPAGV
jgi:small subunit ribosomal protein S6